MIDRIIPYTSNVSTLIIRDCLVSTNSGQALNSYQLAQDQGPVRFHQCQLTLTVGLVRRRRTEQAELV